MLEPTNWRLRGQRLYGIKGDRSPLILCRGLEFPLVRIDSDFKGDYSHLRKAGSIQQVVNNIASADQAVPFESRYYIFPTSLGDYSLQWNPIASLPQGYLQVWEYCGDISRSLLNQLIAYSNGDSMPLYHAPQTASATVSTLSSITDVQSSATAVELLPNNPARLGFGVFNLSTSVLYLAMGETASASNFTARLEPNDYYEPPINYTGSVSGIWASANGSAKITELS